MKSSSPSAGLPPLAAQRGRSRTEERSRSRERVPPHSSSRASQQPQPAVPPAGAQQIQPLATQGTDDDSATVESQNRVSDRSRAAQRKESPQKQGPQKQEVKNTIAEMKQNSELPKARKQKSVESDEDDEEPQNEPGTSSNSQHTVPVEPLHQVPASCSKEPAASSQGPIAPDNSVDDNSEYSDEYSARSQDSAGHCSTQIPTF